MECVQISELRESPIPKWLWINAVHGKTPLSWVIKTLGSSQPLAIMSEHSFGVLCASENIKPYSSEASRLTKIEPPMVVIHVEDLKLYSRMIRELVNACLIRKVWTDSIDTDSPIVRAMKHVQENLDWLDWFEKFYISLSDADIKFTNLTADSVIESVDKLIEVLFDERVGQVWPSISILVNQLDEMQTQLFGPLLETPTPDKSKMKLDTDADYITPTPDKQSIINDIFAFGESMLENFFTEKSS
tara:strand:- start:541 stop:1275 length:735 start_codon:yes stop_codon:yes gene_type:complete